MSKLYTAAYHHRYGVSVWPFYSDLDQPELGIAVIERLDDWEGGTPPDYEDGREDEWLDITGPHDDIEVVTASGN